MPENEKPIEKIIEEFAELQFTDDELAILMEMTLDDLTRTYRRSIDRGRLKAEAEVRRSIYKLAKDGSTPAQKQFQQLNEAAKYSRT